MLQKDSIHRTIEVFFVNPTKKHYLMGISRRIGLAHTSVKKNLNILCKTGMIKESVEKKGGRKFPTYIADVNNRYFKKYKRIYNISSVLESGLAEFIEEKLAPKSLALFGSYLNGEDTENSDIDIFVECKKEELDLSRYEKRLNRKIGVHFNNDFKSYPKELKNNIINGIVLSGFLEGFK